jgi:hypothetical protein
MFLVLRIVIKGSHGSLTGSAGLGHGNVVSIKAIPTVFGLRVFSGGCGFEVALKDG